MLLVVVFVGPLLMLVVGGGRTQQQMPGLRRQYDVRENNDLVSIQYHHR